MTEPPELASLLAELGGHASHNSRSEIVRLTVRLRARDACEYCLMPTMGQFHVDHVVPRSRWGEHAAEQSTTIQPMPNRRGPDHLDNFAWSCPFCNGAKSERTAIKVGRRTTRLFDPRRDAWQEHFVLVHNHLLIVGLTAIGRATERVMRFNDARLGGPLATRHDTILLGVYPPSWARSWLLSVDM